MQDQQEAHLTFLADPRWHASKTISPPPCTSGKSRKLATGGQLRFLLGRLRKAVGERVHTQGGTSSSLLPAHRTQIPLGIANWDKDRCALKSHWLARKIECRESILLHQKHISQVPQHTFKSSIKEPATIMARESTMDPYKMIFVCELHE